jgi:hypothetical protein
MKEKIFFADYSKFRDFFDFSESNGYSGPKVLIRLPFGAAWVLVPP